MERIKAQKKENPLVIVNQILVDGSAASGDVTIPEGVTVIGAGAFFGNRNLTGITFPDSLISIGQEAFFGNWSLTGVTFPDSLTSIGQEAFFGCDSLTSVTLPKGVELGTNAFDADCVIQ